MNELLLRARRKFCFLTGNVRGVKRTSNLISGHRAANQIRARFDETIPPVINVEINTDCNYACPFCPQSSFRRPSVFMTRPVFDVLLLRLEQIRYSGDVWLSVNNEPFLHPLILQFCEVISERLPSARGGLISNGAVVTIDHLRALALLARPPSIRFNDYTPQHSIAKRIEGWVASESELSRIPMSISLRGRDEHLSNRAGNQPGCDSRMADYRDIFCTWPFGSMFLTPELKVFLCCSDYRHEFILGDLNNSSIMDIWAGPEFRKLRVSLLAEARAGISLCRRCDAEWFCLPEHCQK